MKELDIYEIKQIQLNILRAIDEFCKKNSIQYYLYYGTLIGALRHKGYIPWDDDIDICMPRVDYDRFFSTFNKHYNDYRAISIQNREDYYLINGKVIDTRTSITEDYTVSTEIGVFVDVFPLDVIPNNVKLQKKQIRQISFLRKLLEVKNTPIRKNRGITKNLILTLGQGILYAVPAQFFIKKIEKLAKSYDHLSSSNRIGVISCLPYGEREILEKSLFGKGREAMFEGEIMVIPTNAEDILNTIYGDYMALPPKEKQVTHHSYVAFMK